jgi:hypothetical protein
VHFAGTVSIYNEFVLVFFSFAITIIQDDRIPSNFVSAAFIDSWHVVFERAIGSECIVAHDKGLAEWVATISSEGIPPSPNHGVILLGDDSMGCGFGFIRGLGLGGIQGKDRTKNYCQQGDRVRSG